MKTYKAKKNRGWRAKVAEFTNQHRKIRRKFGKWNLVEYTDYLNSEKWKEKRLAFLKHHREKGTLYCYKCKRPAHFGFPVHHLNYDNVGDEKFSDLRICCYPCHKAIHPHLGNK